MNKPCKELKRIARENLNDHYSVPMGALVIGGLITLAVELPFSMLHGDNSTIFQNAIFYIAEFLISLLSIILSVGQLKIHINMARKQPYEFKQLFFGFKNHPDRILVSGLILALLSIVCCIPAGIGVVVFALNMDVSTCLILVLLTMISMVFTVILQLIYQQLYYIILDHPEFTIKELFKHSSQLMKGHKGRLFYMYLSFIGMDLLIPLSLGIAALWIMPYQTQTFTLFYLDVIGELPEQTAEQMNSANGNYQNFNQYV